MPYKPKPWSLDELEAFFLNHDDPWVETIQEEETEDEALKTAFKAISGTSVVTSVKDMTIIVKKFRESV